MVISPEQSSCSLKLAALASSPLAVGLETAVEASKPMRDLAAPMADCLGMLGGNYRRLDKLKEAQDCFERGRNYEESPALEVMSSYNSVNAITLPLESDDNALAAQRSKIEDAVATIGARSGERRSDRRAWADLAQCQLLLGDLLAAMQSYNRVRELVYRLIMGIVGRFPGSVYFVEYFLAVGMPDVAFWFQVMLCEVKVDGVNELGHRSEAARQYGLLAEIAEEAFDHVHP